jgi:hypothetical protein
VNRLQSRPAKIAGFLAFLFFLVKGLAWLGVGFMAWWHTR